MPSAATAHPAPERIVSAVGYATVLGGGPMSPAARTAMLEATQANWSILELQEWAGAVIAQHTGADAGWVTCGAGAGLSLAAAACIAGGDRVLISSLPNVGDVPHRIVIQRGHRQSYDRAFLLAGAEIVEVGFPPSDGIGSTHEWELEAALGSGTAAVAFCAAAERGGIPLKRVCELAHGHGVPVIVDAADQLPPVSNLRRYLDEGADLVAFSGGKAIRGPQTSGILAGRRDLIESVRLQALDMYVDPGAWAARFGAQPPHHGIGRVMKVSKEDIFGLVAALEEFVAADHDAVALEYAGWLASVRDELGAGTLQTEGAFYPRLVFQLGSEGVARRLATQLACSRPGVIVQHHTLVRGEVLICPESITDDDREHVIESLRTALEACGDPGLVGNESLVKRGER